MDFFKESKLFWKFMSGIYLYENPKFLHSLLSALLNIYHIIALAITIYGGIIKYFHEQDVLDPGYIVFIFLQTFSISSIMINYIFYCIKKMELIYLMRKFEKHLNKRINIFTKRIYENAKWKSMVLTKWPFIIGWSAYCGALILITLIFLFIQ